jgi:hypothetical protein
MLHTSCPQYEERKFQHTVPPRGQGRRRYHEIQLSFSAKSAMIYLEKKMRIKLEISAILLIIQSRALIAALYPYNIDTTAHHMGVEPTH